MEALSDSAAVALCGLAQKALEEKGVDPLLAAAFAERACRPLVRRGVRTAGRVVRTAGGKVKRKASAYNKKYAKAYKALKKKHPRTPFATLAKKAHAKAKRMK